MPNGCPLVKRQTDGRLLWGVVVETEAYSQVETTCRSYRRSTLLNETLLEEAGVSDKG